ncbi:MAG: retropepsin-like aspartic protease [Planctomycetaceae bacterium]
MQFPTLAKDRIRRPIVPVRLLGPNGRWSTIDALIDTGSDITLFPERLAERLGLNLAEASEFPLTSALGTVATYRAMELKLEVRRFPETVRWQGLVGFLPRQMTYGLLGTQGFFEFFDLQYSSRRCVTKIESADINC